MTTTSETMKPPTRAVGYVRVSTSEQVNEGVSLDAQRAAIEAWCRTKGHCAVKMFADEGVSGGDRIEKRPGLLAALESLTRGSVLVVVKRDRLARDVFLSCWIEKEVKRRGARTVSVTGEGTDNDDPSSVLMRRLIDAFAEYERAVIRARTKAAMAHKRANGQRVGTVPFGSNLSDDGNALIPNEAEQAVVNDIRAMRGRGMTLKRIAVILTEKGIPTKTRRSSRWSHQAVASILKRLSV